MSTEKYSIGLKSLKTGDIAGDGGMGSSLATLANTFEGSASMTQEEPETNDFFAEEVDDPVVTSSKKGKTVLEFAIMDWHPDTIIKTMGGTVTGTGTAAVWAAPSDIPTIEKSVEIVTKTNVKIAIPRAKLEGRMDARFTRNELALIRIRATILQPTKEAEPPYKVSQTS